MPGYRSKDLSCTGFKPGAGGMGAIPIPAMNRRAMHGVETPTRRADSNPAMNCRAKHILIPPIPAINRWTMHGVETPTRRAITNPGNELPG